MAAGSDILVIAACSDGSVNPETQDLIVFSRRLQALRGGAVRVLVLGDDMVAAARSIARQSGFDVTAVHIEGIANYVYDAYRDVLSEEILASAPAYVCAAHTSEGAEWAPAVAARIGGACISGVDAVLEEDGRVCFEKDLFGGKVKGRFAPRTTPCILTVQPGAFKETISKGPAPGRVSSKKVVCRPAGTRFLGRKPGAAGSAGLAEAKVIVAAGNGIGDPDNLELIRRLARMFPNAAVAGSRIVCDRGWLRYHRQVGVTGATVSPALYIACGISGASQHVAGMRGSGFVVAINTDAHAPIFNDADVGIVEDLTRFIPLVEEAHALLPFREFV